MAGRCGWVRWLLAAFLAGLAIFAPAQARPLVFAFGEHNEAPFALVERGQLKGGFIADFGRALAIRLGREAAFRFVPRNRITAEIQSGSVDAYCLAAQPYYPAFTSESFTQPLFSDQDIILMSAGLRGPADLSSLVGTRVGTVLGFLYPPLVEALFARGEAERIDARNAEGNLRKLQGRRLDAVILPLAAWRYMLSRDPSLAGSVRPDFISIAARDRMCLVSPSGTVTVAEMNAAIQTLADDGTLTGLVRAIGVEPKGLSIPSPATTQAPARR